MNQTPRKTSKTTYSVAMACIATITAMGATSIVSHVLHDDRSPEAEGNAAESSAGDSTASTPSIDDESLDLNESEDGKIVVEDSTQGQLETSNFPRTYGQEWGAGGATYGSDAEAETMSDAPDLIGVVADGGQNGYVRKRDLYLEDGVSTPAEALEYEKQLPGSGAASIPVFNLQGGRIGKFTLARGTVTENDAP